MGELFVRNSKGKKKKARSFTFRSDMKHQTIFLSEGGKKKGDRHSHVIPPY